jgi:hypothetical protein
VSAGSSDALGSTVPTAVSQALRAIERDAARQGYSAEELRGMPRVSPTSAGMIECLFAGAACDLEQVAGLSRLESEDPERLAELWLEVLRRRRGLRLHRLQRQRDRRELAVVQRRVAGCRWSRSRTASSARTMAAPARTRARSRAKGRARRRAQAAPRASRAGPGGESEPPHAGGINTGRGDR